MGGKKARVGKNPLSWIKSTTNQTDNMPDDEKDIKVMSSKKQALDKTENKIRKNKEKHGEKSSSDLIKIEDSPNDITALKLQENCNTEVQENEISSIGEQPVVNLEESILLPNTKTTNIPVEVYEKTEPRISENINIKESIQHKEDEKRKVLLNEKIKLTSFSGVLNTKFDDGFKEEQPYYIIPLSAKTETALEQKVADLLEWIETEAKEFSIGDAAYTLMVGRSNFPIRFRTVADSFDELKRELNEIIEKKTFKNYINDCRKDTNKNLDNAFMQLAKSLMKELRTPSLISRSEYREKLSALADLYIKGCGIEWEDLYNRKKFRRIPMPTYPFAREEYLVKQDINEVELIQEQKPVMMYCNKEWQEGILLNRAGVKKISGTVLIFNSDNEFVKGMIESFDEFGSVNVIQVKFGDSFQNYGRNEFSINISHYEDYVKLFEELKIQNLYPEKLIYAWQSSDNNAETLGFLKDINEKKNVKNFSDKMLSLGLFPMYYIIKALVDTKIKSLNRMMVLHNVEVGEVEPFAEAISGFSGSIGFILNNAAFSFIQVEHNSGKGNFAFENVINEICVNDSVVEREVKFKNDKKYVRKFKQIKVKENENIGFKKNGTYLITGGAGALGLIFARYLAENYQANIILTGRSKLDSEKEKKISELNASKGNVHYIQANVGEITSMKEAVNFAKSKFGKINGVIHAAGSFGEKLISQKNFDEYSAALFPKVQGTIVLDEATKDEPLDFFAMFSSASAVLGDFGQCDYASGNRFMDAYLEIREAMRREGFRTGRSISINWPLWKEGGMHGNKQEEIFYLKTSGMTYLESVYGVKAFEKILTSDYSSVVVFTGNEGRIRQFLKMDTLEREVTVKQKAILKKRVQAAKREKNNELSIEVMLQSDVQKTAAELIKIQPERIIITESLGEYGFDSINLKELAIQLGEIYSIEVSPTVFFAHSNVQSICEYLMNEYCEEIKGYYRSVEAENTVDEEEEEYLIDTLHESEKVRVAFSDNYIDENNEGQASECTTKKIHVHSEAVDDIAIIGISGVFPGANDIEEFWENLICEKDMISEIPNERWDWREFCENQEEGGNVSCLKWGGFIKDIDKFDPLFFNISPLEAMIMDPQHRILLQTVWKTIEDGGYKASELSGKSVGVFVGVQFADYQTLMNESEKQMTQVATSNGNSMLGNRISYFLNFKGPSESIDTACSSSLVALHRAAKSIQSGESELAVVGGVNLIVSPHTFMTVSRLGVLSPDGRCMTFDKKANGYARGEGAGAVLLKPLKKAIKDNDYIYAVIKGSAENHGGKANSLTAPNPEAQANLIVTAYESAGFEPDTVSYIEAHGTGTELGDPIEIDGLKKAFDMLYGKNAGKAKRYEYCGIGTVKTNIGHLEPAAGMAGLMKIIMSMKHKKLPRTLHFKNQNPYIKLNKTPFYIVDKTMEWKKLHDRNGNDIPRRAGLSSFGYGGTNAHIAFEEYVNVENVLSQNFETPCIICISAKNESSLKEYALKMGKQLKDMLITGEIKDNSLYLNRIAYTLQIGREEMEERLAIVTSSIKDLKEQLLQYSTGQAKYIKLYKGNVAKKKARELAVTKERDAEYIRRALKERDLDELCSLWMEGAHLDWKQLYNDKVLKRLPLPTYPFAKESYWVKGASDQVKAKKSENGFTNIHPLLGRNISNFNEQKFLTKIKGNEFFIADHVINKEKILPGVAYLEMARISSEISAEAKVKQISDILWLKPIVVYNSPVEVQISLYPLEDSLDFEIHTADDGFDRIVHAQGKVNLDSSISDYQKNEYIRIDDVKERCFKSKSGEVCYEELKNTGFEYGSGFKAIKKIYYSKSEALSILELPQKLREGFEEYTLHPTLMDGALQTISVLFGSGEYNKEALYLPFSIGSIDIAGALPEKCYAYAKVTDSLYEFKENIKKCEVIILGEDGRIIVRVKDFQVREVKKHVKTRKDMLEVLRRLKDGELDISEAELMIGGQKNG